MCTHVDVVLCVLYHGGVDDDIVGSVGGQMDSVYYDRWHPGTSLILKVVTYFDKKYRNCIGYYLDEHGPVFVLTGAFCTVKE